MAAAAAAPEEVEAMRNQAPATQRRSVNNHDEISQKPYTRRGVVAAEGSFGHEHRDNLTALQQHVEFFDRNKDGIVYPLETFRGFRALGFGYFISVFAMVFINTGLSYPTLNSWIPSLFFPIYIKNIHRAKHGSDTEIYDFEGRFLPSKFEEMFGKFAGTHPDRLTLRELLQMSQAIRNALDPFGWMASKLELVITYLLLKDENGLVAKEAIRGVYDGSIFYYMEKKQAEKRIAKKHK